MSVQQFPKFDIFSLDKLDHAAAYGLLWLLSMWGFRQVYRPDAPPHRAPQFLFLGAVAYGVLMEYVQFYFCQGRMYEFDDMLANAIGALAAWGLWRWLLARLISK